jgi:hypothetical protein
MANFFSLYDGNLTDASVYGYSLSSAEVMTGVSGVSLGTVDAYGPIFTGDGSTISAVAVHLSARQANNTTDSLILKLSATGKSIQTEYYPISNFTSYNGSNNLLATYPLNWQILKLSAGYVVSNLSSARISLAVTTSGVISLIGVSANNNFDKAVIASTATIPSSNDTLHLGGSIKLSATEIRTITVNTSSYQNLYVHNQGVLTFPLTSSKTLTLNGSAGLQITSDGTLNIGTSSSVIPLSTTHTINLSNNQIDVHNGGNLNFYGYPKAFTTNLVNDTVSASNTFTTVDNVSSIWNVGDILTFKPSLSFRTGFDTLTLSGFTSSNTFKTTSNSVYTHTGSATYANIAGVYNLSRNVSLSGNIYSESGANVNLYNSSINSNSVLPTTVNSLTGNVFNDSFLSLKSTPTLIGTNLSATAFTSKFPVSPTRYTVETWMYYVNAFETNNIFLRYNPTGGNAYGITISSTSLYINCVNGGTDVSKTFNFPTYLKLSANKWFHFAVCVTTGNIQSFYINGYLIGSATFNRDVGFNINSLDDNHTLDRTVPLYLYNFRIVNGESIYSSNFIPSWTYRNPTIGIITTSIFSTSGTTTSMIDLADNSTVNRIGAGTFSYVSIANPNNYKYINYNNNIFYKSNKISFDGVSATNFIFSNNYILSSVKTGLEIINSTGTLSMSNNTTIGSLSYGTYISNNTLTGTYGANNFNSALQGMYVSGTNMGTIVGGGLNSAKEGVYVDASTGTLSGVTFQNILANNNTSVGFKVSGNSLNYLTPVVLNINGLNANTNSDAGIEAYNITGNISSLVANNNLSASRISIGNGATIFDGLTSSLSATVLNILSGYNYSYLIIKNALLSSTLAVSGVGIRLDSTRFSQFSLENSTISAAIPLQLITTRNLLEGSYLFNNSILGSTPLGASGITNIYQPYTTKNTGFAFTNLNKIVGNNISYYAHGAIYLDSTIFADTSASERLVPNTTTVKLKSASKFVALNSGDYTTVFTYVRKSTLSGGDSADYNGSSPRLMLKRNPSMGINNDTVLATLDYYSTAFEKLIGTSPVVSDNGVLEFYVDCDGTQGWINVDSWSAS